MIATEPHKFIIMLQSEKVIEKNISKAMNRINLTVKRSDKPYLKSESSKIERCPSFTHFSHRLIPPRR